MKTSLMTTRLMTAGPARRALLALCLCWSVGAGAADPPSRIEDRRGEALMNDGRHEEAEDAFAKALAIEPNNGRAILLRAENERRAAGDGAQPRAVVDLAGVPLEEQDLSSLDLTGLEIVDAHAPRSLWAGARLRAMALTRAQFNGADLSDALILDSDLDGAILDDANLARAALDGSRFARARAPRLMARGASLQRVRATAADFADADFTGADLSFADLRAGRFGAARFEGARLINADLRGADLARARLAGAILAGARVDCATRLPPGLDPDAALLVPLDLCGGRFALDYRGKALDGVSFRDLDLRGALMQGARIAQADFTGANLDGADLSGVSDFGARFAPASAREASLENARGELNDLLAADLRNARLSGAPGAALDILVGPHGPRLDGASLVRVRLTLHPFAQPERERASLDLGLRSLLRAQIEEATIVCASPPATRARGAQDAADYAEALDIARRLAAAPGVSLHESCRRAPRARSGAQ
jgi:uncharacterized protein YjbI with pentapeptide repeats